MEEWDGEKLQLPGKLVLMQRLERSQDLGRIGAIVDGLADVRVCELGVWGDDEHASELVRVALGTVGAEASTESTKEAGKGLPAKAPVEFAPELQGTVSDQLRIDQQAERTVGSVAENAPLLRAPGSEQRQLGAEMADLLGQVAQLRDFLVTEDSAEVAEEDQDRCSVLP